MLRVAVMCVQIDVIGLRRLHGRNAAHNGVKTRLGFELAVDEDIAHARGCVGMIFDFRRRPHLGLENIAGILGKIPFSFGKIKSLVFMGVATIRNRTVTVPAPLVTLYSCTAPVGIYTQAGETILCTLPSKRICPSKPLRSGWLPMK